MKTFRGNKVFQRFQVFLSLQRKRRKENISEKKFFRNVKKLSAILKNFLVV